MSIYLSPSHGVNPSMMCCFYCGAATGVALFGQIGPRHKQVLGEELYRQLEGTAGDREAPHSLVVSKEPCDTCKEYMEKGIMLISVSHELTTDEKNPYRTGGFAVITVEAAQRVFAPPVYEHVLSARVAFIDNEAWDQLGLPARESL